MIFINVAIDVVRSANEGETNGFELPLSPRDVVSRRQQGNNDQAKGYVAPEQIAQYLYYACTHNRCIINFTQVLQPHECLSS